MRFVVLSPIGVHTGGPIALEQLADAIAETGNRVALVDPRPHFSGEVTFAEWSSHVGLREDDVVISPEIWARSFLQMRLPRRILWWLSVDSAYPMGPLRRDALYDKAPSRILWRGFERALHSSLNPLLGRQETPILHAAQSEYARNHLARMRIAERGARGAAVMLTDYLSPEMLEPPLAGVTRDKGLVLFNPIKGAPATRRIMAEASSRLRFQPISGLRGRALRSLMSEAVAYIDFGAHPGRDRLPREAAMSGCVVITRRRGAADNSIDIGIPGRYKLRTPSITQSAADIVALLHDVAAAPAGHQEEMADYRRQILLQRDAFLEEVAHLTRTAAKVF